MWGWGWGGFEPVTHFCALSMKNPQKAPLFSKALPLRGPLPPPPKSCWIRTCKFYQFSPYVWPIWFQMYSNPRDIPFSHTTMDFFYRRYLAPGVGGLAGGVLRPGGQWTNGLWGKYWKETLQKCCFPTCYSG